MDAPKRTCLSCGGDNYEFRSRRKVTDLEEPERTEAKFRCRACKHESKVRSEQGGGG
jgi:hypothetical protein